MDSDGQWGETPSKWGFLKHHDGWLINGWLLQWDCASRWLDPNLKEVHVGIRFAEMMIGTGDYGLIGFSEISNGWD